MGDICYETDDCRCTSCAEALARVYGSVDMQRAAEMQLAVELVRCPGEAHSNPHIDNCGICGPRWGVVEVRS